MRQKEEENLMLYLFFHTIFLFFFIFFCKIYCNLLNVVKYHESFCLMHKNMSRFFFAFFWWRKGKADSGRGWKSVLTIRLLEYNRTFLSCFCNSSPIVPSAADDSVQINFSSWLCISARNARFQKQCCRGWSRSNQAPSFQWSWVLLPLVIVKFFFRFLIFFSV